MMQNNCIICGKPTRNKPNKSGDVLCSQQCIFIFDNKESIKNLKSDIAKMLKLMDRRFEKMNDGE